MKCLRFVTSDCAAAATTRVSSSAISIAVKCVHDVSVDPAALCAVDKCGYGVSTQMELQMRALAQCVPANGWTFSQAQSALEQSFPNFDPVSLGVLTIREALSKFPALFRIEEKAPGRWIVKPARMTCSAKDKVHSDSALSSSCLSSNYTHTPVCDLHAIAHYCRSLAQKSLRVGEDVGFTALEDVLSATLKSAVSACLVHELVEHAARVSLEVQVRLRIRPKRPLRSAIVFVDGDGFDRIALSKLCGQLGIQLDDACTSCSIGTRTASATAAVANETAGPIENIIGNIYSNSASSNCGRTSVYVVRRLGSRAIGRDDCITPDAVPTYLGVERQARELRLRIPGIRQDVVYMCRDERFDLYAKHVALSNAFPDADVYVCSPLRVSIVQPKTIIPFV